MKLPTNTVSPPRIGLWSLPPWRYRNPVLTWSIHSSLNELKSSSSRPPSGIACGGLFIVLKACIYTWVILNLNLRAISWARCLLIDGRVSPSFSPCWITSFFSFCESLREPYCVYSWHPNPQVCLPHVPFLVRSPSFSSYLHPPSSSCCCSVSDHPSTAMDTMFVHRLFIWYRYLFPLPNTDYLIFCTFLHFLFWTKQTHLLFPSQS